MPRAVVQVALSLPILMHAHSGRCGYISSSASGSFLDSMMSFMQLGARREKPGRSREHRPLPPRP